MRSESLIGCRTWSREFRPCPSQHLASQPLKSGWCHRSPEPVYALYVLHSLFEPLQGVGNAFIYGSSPRVRALYRGLAAKHLDCLLDDDSEDVPRCELRAGGARGQRQTELAVSTAAL